VKICSAPRAAVTGSPRQRRYAGHHHAEITVVLNHNGTYTTWNSDGEKINDQKPQLSLLLQVLTDEKRFIAN
jgi:membrane-anchored protein YejM (alkaline phosphatase superfamily)